MADQLHKSDKPWNQYMERKGFGGIKFYGAPMDSMWGVSDPQRAEMLAKARNQAFARVVAQTLGSTPLGLISDQDGGTVGAARFAQGTLESFLENLADAPETPDQYRAALRRGAGLADPIEDEGVREALWNLLRLPWAQRVYWKRWKESILDDAWRVFEDLGWKSERGLATLVRGRNSSGTRLNDMKRAAQAAGGSDEEAQIDAALKDYASRKDTYVDRAKEIRQQHGMGAIGPRPDPVRDLYLDGAPQRQGGQEMAMEPPPFVGDSGDFAVLTTAGGVPRWVWWAVGGVVLWWLYRRITRR